MNRRTLLAGASALTVAAHLPAAPHLPARDLLFLGSRSSEKGEGIFTCFFDDASGLATPVVLAAELAMATCFTLSRDRRFLYSTSETGNNDKASGSLLAFAIDRHAGALHPVNTVSSGGGGPTSICTDTAGRHLLVACFGAGCTNVFRLLPSGEIGEQTASLVHTGSGPQRRQASPHAHQVVLAPDNRFLISPDLGADRVYVSRFDTAVGSLAPGDPPYQQMPAGSGPRHAVFHPNGRFLYLISELSASVTVFSWDPVHGRLTELQTIAVGNPGEGAGEVLIRRDGRFLYTTTRLNDMVQILAVDPLHGTLTLTRHISTGGKLPWEIALSPTDRHFLALNLDSNLVTVFRVDAESGALQPTPSTIAVPTPAGCLFLSA